MYSINTTLKLVALKYDMRKNSLIKRILTNWNSWNKKFKSSKLVNCYKNNLDNTREQTGFTTRF